MNFYMVKDSMTYILLLNTVTDRSLLNNTGNFCIKNEKQNIKKYRLSLYSCFIELQNSCIGDFNGELKSTCAVPY